MTIFKTREEAYKRASELKAQHKGAITEGSVALGSMQNGKFVERKFKTFEVWYSRYDEQEGWLECVLTIMYES